MHKTFFFRSYNPATGQFTVPSGGAGLYFFYINFFADDETNAAFTMRVNGAWLCYAYGEMNESPGDNATPSCGAVVTLAEGKFLEFSLQTNCHVAKD